MTSSGLVIVDKPAGLTSHDVVARIRKLAGTRRVGHAGTLDPMATGVLVTGVEKATRLLGHLALAEKEYSATIRLGQATDTDDAEGEVISAADASGISDERLLAAVTALRGEIRQVPPAVSAVKVGGQRAYKLARQGTPARIEARTVTVREFRIAEIRRTDGLLDADVTVICSSGTYIRALARDLGAALGAGGHLTRLRRRRVGPYREEEARTLEELAERFTVRPLAEVAAAAFPRLDVSAAEAQRLAHGGRLPPYGLGGGPAAAFGPDGTFLALVAEEGEATRPLAVFGP